MLYTQFLTRKKENTCAAQIASRTKQVKQRREGGELE